MTLFDKIKNLNGQLSETIQEQQPDTTPEASAQFQQDAGLPVLRNADAAIIGILKNREKDIIEPSSSGIENLYSNVAMSTDFQYWNDAYYGEGNFIPSGIIQDKFRYVSQKFWDVFDGRTMRFLKKDFISSDDVPFSIEVDEGSRDSYYNQDGVEETRTTIKLSPKKTKFASFRSTTGNYVPEVWKNYMTSKERFNIVGRQEIYWDRIVEFNKTFYDSTFSINAPHVDNISKNEKYITVESNYNYYHSSFEEVSSLDSIDENYMPNLYANYSAKNNTQQPPGRLIAINTLNGKMRNVLKSITNPNGTKVLFDYYQIFDEWASNVSSLGREERADLSSYSSHIVLTEDDVEQGMLEEVDPVENTFPASIKVEFMGDPVGQVKGLFSKSRTTDALISAVSNVDILGKAINFPNGSQINFYFDPNKNEPVIQRSLSSFDLDEFVSSSMGQDAFVDGFTFQSSLPLFSKYKTTIDSIKNKENLAESQLSQIINSAIVKGKIRNLINTRSRTATQLMNGSVSYSDTVFYKIDKHKYVNKNSFSPVPSQTIYIPASDKRVLTYLDTQVKYRKRYHYKVYAYVAVFGTEYEYAPLEGKTEIEFDQDDNAYFSIITKSKIDLIQVPYAEKSALLLDKPPTSPSVEFLPYADSSRDIKVSLTSTFGDSLEVPVQVLRTDEKQIYYAMQNQTPDFQGRIVYSGDDKISRYQVFRINYMPEAPEDFSRGQVKYVETNTPNRIMAKTLETSFIEQLVFNRKYYYAFRSVDVHGNISNLSKIFEVEIVNNDGAVYTSIKNVDYAKPETKFRNKNVRKYLRIRAANSQKYFDSKTILDNLGQNKAENISLGPDQQNLWNRKFKFRLTSSDTGRKIDINVKFSYDVKGYEFTFSSGATGQVIQANSFTEALQLLLIEQSMDLI